MNRWKLYLAVRALFFASWLHLLFNKAISNFALKSACLSNLSRWMRTHPCRRFDDADRDDRYKLYQYVFEQEKLDGEISYLEFGVASGKSLDWWVENNKDPASRFIGFDTFTGLPEDWDNVSRGTFTTHGRPPQIEDGRVRYEIGLFQDKLPGFLGRFLSNGKMVVHIDCDLYSSTLFVLTTLAPRLRDGDILIFDEFGSIRHPAHEFRAFTDFISAYRFDYRVIGAFAFYHKVAMRLVLSI